jgi:IclR family acetate operon transcriptional repressor
MLKFGHALLTAAEELCIIGPPSPLLNSANAGTWGNVSDKPPAFASARKAR